MIIDTSALVAVLLREDGEETLLDAMLEGVGFIPTPVLVEFERVSSIANNVPDPMAVTLLEKLYLAGLKPVPFSEVHAQVANSANAEYGSGNGKGGKLNMLDLMVYGTAKAMKLPILCTGRDFALTDALLHSASRLT